MTKLGDFELNNIYCGDSEEMLKQLHDECIDLTVTSPPYGSIRDYNGFVFDFEPIANELYRITKQNGVVVWVVGDETKDWGESGESFKQALYFKSLGFRMETMIYDKNGFQFPHHNRYHQVFEYMFVFSKNGPPKTFNPIMDRDVIYNHRKETITKREKDGNFSARKGWTGDKLSKRYNIWRYSPGWGKTTNDKMAYAHPAMFPEVLAQDHIISWSNVNDIVLDPFMGSGTTAKMCKILQRNYIGFDISQEYVDLAKKRIEMINEPLGLEL